MSTNYCSILNEDSLNRILKNLDEIQLQYSKFFNISKIFSSDDRGKIRLNRDIFNNTHQIIQKNIEHIEIELNAIMEHLREKKTLFEKETDLIQYMDFDTFIFNDQVAIEHINVDVHKELLDFIKCKNIVSNFNYFVHLFNTSFLNTVVNKLSTEELVDGALIFEIIDSYGLQFQKLTQLYNEIKRLEHTFESIKNPQDLNTVLELLKRRCITYEYNNNKYKITLEYNNTIESTNAIHINKNYFEQLLYSLVEQSCLDIIKKELKKGKVQKLITVDIFSKKGVMNVVVENSGFDTNDTTVFDEVGNSENKFILDAKNIAQFLKCEFDISTVFNEGMIYTVTFQKQGVSPFYNTAL